MTEPLQRPPRKDPQRRTRVPTLPPYARSRQALNLTVAAAEGRLMLQVCQRCGKVSYPAREICPCGSLELPWQDIDPGGELLADTTLHTSTNTYFRERMPWRIGTVMLDAGASVLAHLHGDLSCGQRVRVIARTDPSGQGVLFALPEKETPNMADDKQLRTLTCDPKHRRILVTDARTELGQAVVAALRSAGAAHVFAGVAEDWRPFAGRDALVADDGVEIVPLDLTDTRSVEEAAAEIGGRTDILVNTAEHVRPGGAMGRRDVNTARDEMEINYFGPLRLAQAFGPGMKARGADGDVSACAWVNLLSVFALCNWPAFGSTSASQAAAHSLSQCLRAEFAGSGVKLVNLLVGPLEESWRQEVPPPKVTPQKVASTVVHALQQGMELVALGPVAEDLLARWRDNPLLAEREMVAQSLAETGA